MRNNELGGILGLNQLPELDKNVILRNRNHERFISQLDSSKYFTEFKMEGASNYAFNLILREKNDSLCEKLMNTMRAEGIEFRRGSAGGGNQLRQPYMKSRLAYDFHKYYPVTEHIHFYGFYIGNFPSMQESEVDEIVKILNGV